MADRIPLLVGDITGYGRGWGQPKDEILRFEPRSNHDRGCKSLVLLKHLLDIAAAARGEHILPGKHASENKSSIRAPDLNARRILSVGRTERIGEIYFNECAGQRLAAVGINDLSAYAKVAWFYNLRLCGRCRGYGWGSRPLKESQQTYRGQQLQREHSTYSPMFTNSRSILAA